MAQFIPIFPLTMVVFPTERLNLRVLEEPYKQLIKDCYAQQKDFGIIPVIEQKLMDFGTTIEIVEIEELEDGNLNIRTLGKEVFQVLGHTQNIPEKDYAGAIVQNIEQEEIKVTQQLSDLIKQEVLRLYQLLSEDLLKSLQPNWILSYDIAHKVGFSMQEEYHFLQLNNELHRQEMIRRHLKKMEPMLKEMENLKKKIRMNGHFRDVSGADYE